MKVRYIVNKIKNDPIQIPCIHKITKDEWTIYAEIKEDPNGEKRLYLTAENTIETDFKSCSFRLRDQQDESIPYCLKDNMDIKYLI